MTFNRYKVLAAALLTAGLISGCNGQSVAASGNSSNAAQAASQSGSISDDAERAAKQVSLLRDRLPATCYVKDSENLPFCMPGDTMIYEPDPQKEEQTPVNEVIGGFCDATKPFTINGSSVICTFHQNRTYNANPVNQQAIVASNIQVGRDYLSHVAQMQGVRQLAPGLYVLPLVTAPEGSPAVTNDVAIQIETKLLTTDLRVHSYMLDDRLTLESLAPGNPFARVFPTLRKGDVVRVYIDFARFPNVWNVDSSLMGLPYIWEVRIMDIKPKPLPAPAAPAQAPAEALESSQPAK